MSVEEKVQIGVAYVEENYGADWFEKIDTFELDVSNSDRCIIGQLDGSPESRPIGMRSDLGFVGDDYTLCSELTSEWRRVIEERLSQSA